MLRPLTLPARGGEGTRLALVQGAGAPSLQASSARISKSSPFFSKFFPNIPLAVLGDFKGLQGSRGRFAFLQIFAAAGRRREGVDLARLETGACLTVTRILIFRKEKVSNCEPSAIRTGPASDYHVLFSHACRQDVQDVQPSLARS